MRLSQFFKKRPFVLSIEIFPPKSEAGDAALFQSLEELAAYRPAFISCTYGAGGTTRTRTVEICREIQSRFETPATAHFTCVGSTCDDLREWLTYAKDAGIQNIMALRGDAPKGESEFQAVEGGLRYANELVAFIREHVPDMGIGVGGYPEKHPEAPSHDIDLENLKRKVDAGADAIFTQLFYVNEYFFRFRDACDKAGIQIPVVPGIMPITNFTRIKRITALCGSEFPTDLSGQLEAVQDDDEAQFDIGVEFASEQCRELIEAGVPGIHFYALNKSQACSRILDNLGLKPATAVT